MVDESMLAKMEKGDGFIAALDQSGGSTPGALRLYGVPDDAYHSEEEMFALVHAMRVRIITAPAFEGGKVIGAILFERTMDDKVGGRPVPDFLWRQRGIVPFLKVDKGLAPEADGVSLMKPIPGLDALLDRALALGVFGTKMRSVINSPSPTGIAAAVDQQFDFGARILAKGLVPILEPEVSIKSPDKARCEDLLLREVQTRLDNLPAGRRVMLKLTIPETPNHYSALVEHPKVIRVVALSGGYSRAEACERLAFNRGMIASFSRALAEDLKASMDDGTFAATLASAIDEIYAASVFKR